MTEQSPTAAAERLMTSTVCFPENEAGTGVRLFPQAVADIRAVCKAVLSAPRWQGIESAPKDGTDFLGYWSDTEEMHVVCIHGDECERQMDREKWMMPTAWIPLPASPQGVCDLHEPRKEST